jgi:hypothetical protein
MQLNKSNDGGDEGAKEGENTEDNGGDERAFPRVALVVELPLLELFGRQFGCCRRHPSKPGLYGRIDLWVLRRAAESIGLFVEGLARLFRHQGPVA